MWQQAFGHDVIKPRILNGEWKVLLADRGGGKYPMTFGSWGADYDQASTFTNLFNCDSGTNNAKYCNPAYDKLTQEASNEADKAKRTALYTQAERTAMDDYPVVPLFQKVTKRLIKPYVEGYVGNPMDHLHTQDMYIIKH